MIKYILHGFFLLIVMVSFGQKPINYAHKNIDKEIDKFWGLEHAQLNEIYIPDSLVQKNHIQGKYFEVSSANGLNRPHYAYIGRVNSCRAGGCSISIDPMENYESEYFDYFILFNATCEVELVRVFNYAATHGHEIAAKGWLKQFTGHNGSDKLIVGKNVDAISGATISVYGITLDVQMKTEILKELHLLNLTRLIHKLKPVSR